MIKKRTPFAATVGAMLMLPMVSQAQTSMTYNGNGGAGFGGPVGNGSLTVTRASSGDLTFAFTPGTSFSGNDLVIYLDTINGGVNNTSTFTDTGDGGRTAISGTGSSGRTLAQFTPSFTPDYAFSVQPSNISLFNLSTPSNFGFVSSLGASTPGAGTGPFTVTVAPTALGLTSGQGFNFVGTLISTTAYRSNETFGTSTTTPGTPGDAPNAGFNGTVTFADFNTFPAAIAPTPEPGGLVPMLVGTALLGGVIVARRRRGLHA